MFDAYEGEVCFIIKFPVVDSFGERVHQLSLLTHAPPLTVGIQPYMSDVDQLITDPIMECLESVPAEKYT